MTSLESFKTANNVIKMETVPFSISKPVSIKKPMPGSTPMGRQVTIEYALCSEKILNDAEKIESAMKHAAVSAGATIVDSSFHCCKPQGISGVVIIAKSHFTIHTWPEYQYAAVDIFTCGSTIDISKAVHEMAEAFASEYHIISSDTWLEYPKTTPRNIDSDSEENISVHLIQWPSCPPSRQAMITLYKDAGWWEEPQDGNLEFLDAVVKNSFLFAGAFYGNKLIGMGRALSDGVSDAYIQDVVVLNSFRGKGLGKKLIQILIQGLKEKKIDWIGLIGEPNTAPFYEQLGFSELKDYIPMKLTN